MKLLRVHIISADTCGGLLDGVDRWLRSPSVTEYYDFDPLCLIGPNGSGKSQFLQVLTEIFQTVYSACVPGEERIDGNPDLQFEVEYLIKPMEARNPVHVLISRQSVNRRRPQLAIFKKNETEWENCDLDDPETQKLLPQKIVGYTSGENETLSLPFLISRSGYAEEVRNSALSDDRQSNIPDTRLLLIDYGTNLEVVVSNLIMSDNKQLKSLLDDARLRDIHSFRCVIQLAHSAISKLPGRKKANPNRKGVQLTQELERYIESLKRSATCYTYDEKAERYIFDYWVNDQTKIAFHHFWESTLELYTSLHKLAMLNDLAIPKRTRERFRKDTKKRRFASRLPEPQDEDKVFRFDQVQFKSSDKETVVEYVSLSDGEHQLLQILGIFSMVSFSNVLFVLDEPESHLNPQWRVKFISRLLDLPTKGGMRGSDAKTQVAEQECLLTTHAPFVPSDMSRNKVFIFGKEGMAVKIEHPDIETFGTTFDTILEECFSVRPPISKVSLDEIEALMKSEDPEEIKEGMNRLGHSVEKVFLADRLQQLTQKDS
jgi:restriction system-associated AAA family ATPase